MIEAVTAIDCRKLPINTESIQHRTAKVHGLICQYGQLTVVQTVQSLSDTGIQRGTIQHMSAVIAQKHLQSGLNIRLARILFKGSPDKRQCAVSDETSD